MFEVFAIVTFLVSGDVVTFSSDKKWDTMEECVLAIPRSYDRLKAHVLDHVIEKIEVKRGCRPVEKGV